MFKTRKQMRKDKRKEKKMRHANRPINQKSEPTQRAVAQNYTIKNKPVNIGRSNDKVLSEHKRKLKQEEKLAKEMNRQRKKQLMNANEEEDRIIKALEKKLKMVKRRTKSLPKAFKDEGLDYILELCDRSESKCSNFEDDQPLSKSNMETKKNEEKQNKIQKLTPKDSTSMKSDDETPEEYSSQRNQKPGNSKADRMKRLQEMVDEHGSKKRKSTSSDDGNINRNKKTYDNSDVISNEDEFNDIEESVDCDTNQSDEECSGEEESEINDNDDIDNSDDDVNDTDNDADDMNSEVDDTDSGGEDTDSGGENTEKQYNSEHGKKKNKYWEDIYGRTRDSAGNIVKTPSETYVPPHRKLNNDTQSVDLSRLQKQLKGFLNKLTEANMHSISRQIEDVYMSYSHNNVNETLISLITSSLISNALSPESIVMEHAMLIALLHANVGYEVGAYILQHFVEKFAKMLDGIHAVEDKTVDNMLFFICHLYNFKVFSSCLLFDILKKLGDTFTEKDIDLILLTLKTVGFVLRKDDPHSLKELIVTLQIKARDSEHHKQNVRVKFMLDTLLAIKNNNMTKIPQYDPTRIERLKKLIRSMIRTGQHLTELKITVDDILNVETRGRWWIVGSAWRDDKRFKNNPSSNNTQNGTQLMFSKEILKLAQQQRMNTDTRKNVFCILVTAEDYLDAFEKLMKLDLKGAQHREIVHVLVHCFLRENRYNPYYVYLAEHLCSVNRMYQLAIQFAMWDRFKEINSLSSLQINHISKFLSYLFLESGLSISILKVIQFTEMDKSLLQLVKSTLLNTLLCDSDEKLVNAFYSVSKFPSLSSLRQSLQIFLRHFILKNIEADGVRSDLTSDQIESLPIKVTLAEKAMFKFSNEFN